MCRHLRTSRGALRDNFPAFQRLEFESTKGPTEHKPSSQSRTLIWERDMLENQRQAADRASPCRCPGPFELLSRQQYETSRMHQVLPA